MVDIVTCLEHQSIPVKNTRQPGEFALTEEHAHSLSKLRCIPKGAFREGHRSITWRQFCGVVQLGTTTLEILPKIHGHEMDAGSCKRALVRMLRRCGLIKIHKGSSASASLQRHTLLDIFILEFCLLVRESLTAGKPRQYKLIEENGRVIRGKFLVSQQIRLNQVHRERVYCQYDELTTDVPLNQVIKHTLNTLLAYCQSNTTKQTIGNLLYHYDDVSTRTFTPDEVDQIHLNRLTEGYRPALDWAKIFLALNSPDVFSGSQRSISILFDMNKLFEGWLAAELRSFSYEAGLTVREQAPRRSLALRMDTVSSLIRCDLISRSLIKKVR